MALFRLSSGGSQRSLSKRALVRAALLHLTMRHDDMDWDMAHKCHWHLSTVTEVSSLFGFCCQAVGEAPGRSASALITVQIHSIWLF